MSEFVACGTHAARTQMTDVKGFMAKNVTDQGASPDNLAGHTPMMRQYQGATFKADVA